MLIPLIKTMRPKQWLKNIFIFAPLIFDVKLFDLYYVGRTVGGFIALCLISGTVYIINDLVDIEKDRQHPKKRFRPLAAGELSKRSAIVGAIVIPAITLPLAYLLDPLLGVIITTYLLTQIAYSFWLKNVAIIDALTVASGFILRVAAGVPLVEAERFSPWLYICMMLLALLMSFGKRRHELILLKETANAHRNSLKEYSLSMLDHIISIVTASLLLAYALYTFSAPNLPQNHTMMLTIPFVLYGMFRYLYLIHVEGRGGAPEELALTDRPLQFTVVLWGLSAITVMYLFD